MSSASIRSQLMPLADQLVRLTNTSDILGKCRNRQGEEGKGSSCVSRATGCGKWSLEKIESRLCGPCTCHWYASRLCYQLMCEANSEEAVEVSEARGHAG